MFYNAHGLLMHNMMWVFDYTVQAGMPKRKNGHVSPDYPRDPAQVYLWLEEAGWQIMGKTGVRVFHDYLREKHQQRDCYEALLELECVIAVRNRILPWGVIFMSPRANRRARIKYE